MQVRSAPYGPILLVKIVGTPSRDAKRRGHRALERVLCIEVLATLHRGWLKGDHP